jgi:hypothetical protein
MFEAGGKSTAVFQFFSSSSGTSWDIASARSLGAVTWARMSVPWPPRRAHRQAAQKAEDAVGKSFRVVVHSGFETEPTLLARTVDALRPGDVITRARQRT